MNTPTNMQTKDVLAARAEASAWITRLHGPSRTPDLEAGFRRWLEERPENREEFEGLTEVWDLVAGGTLTRGMPRLERWEQSAEALELQALRRQYRTRKPRAARFWAQAAVFALIVGFIASSAYHFWPTPSYVTSVGEQRIMRLPDGTRVSLNSNSRLSMGFDETARVVTLKQGEAFFEVAKDPRRPFTVAAGDHKVTALGTSFVVRNDERQLSVTLVDGKVSVASVPVSGFSGLSEQPHTNSRTSDNPENPDTGTVILSPGQRLTLAARSAPKLDTPRIEAVTAWRRGEVMLDDTPLLDAVAEMNRYDATAIVVDDPAIGGLIVSGLYHTGDSEGFAKSVARMYRLKVVESDGQIHLRK